jgi:hypothetical protein
VSVTVTPAIGLPDASLTWITIGVPKGVPTATLCPPPESTGALAGTAFVSWKLVLALPAHAFTV